MEEIKEKAIELLLDIVSKEDFEMILYEKVKTEDLIKNSLLFDLVDINYREENYKKSLLEILKNELVEEAFIIYKVKLYSERIKDENDSEIIFQNFNKIYDLFEFDKEYNLMWDFYNINVKLDLVEIGYEKESYVIKNLKKVCFLVCSEFNRLSNINEKVSFLIDGFKNEEEIKPIKKQINYRIGGQKKGMNSGNRN